MSDFYVVTPIGLSGPYETSEDAQRVADRYGYPVARAVKPDDSTPLGVPVFVDVKLVEKSPGYFSQALGRAERNMHEMIDAGFIDVTVNVDFSNTPVVPPPEACGRCGTRAVVARKCGFCGARS